MRHRNRPSGQDLLFKGAGHRAVRSQHIAEAGGDEGGFVAGFEIEALDVDLGQPLGSAHHVGGVHRLVGRDHDEFIGAGLRGNFGQVAGAKHIHPDGFEGVGLHERYMLVGRGMVNEVGLHRSDKRPDALLTAHIGDHVLEAHLLMVFATLQLLFKFGEILLQFKQGRFGLVDQHYPPWIKIEQLPRKLVANAACRPGDQHRLAKGAPQHLLVVKSDGFALKQILDVEVLYLFHVQLTIDPAIDGRHALDIRIEADEPVVDLRLLLLRNVGHGQNNLRNVPFGQKHVGHVVRAVNLNTLHRLAYLARHIVHEPHHPVGRFLRARKGMHHADALLAGAVNQHVHLFALVGRGDAVVGQLDRHPEEEQEEEGQRVKDEQHRIGDQELIYSSRNRHGVADVAKQLQSIIGACEQHQSDGNGLHDADEVELAGVADQPLVRRG